MYPLSDWLRCPRCALSLEVLGGLVLGCEAGHRFDANRRGYLTTLNASKGISGDSRAILEARQSFLAFGHYRPIMDAVAGTLPTGRPLAVLDAGTGTGAYLAHVLQAGSDRTALALDASAAAVGMACAATSSPGLVADTWQPLAIRDDRADVVLCVFAPRNAAEFARVLRPDGLLVVVTPGPRHLEQLRAAGLVIGMQDDKRERLASSLGGHFSPVSSAQLAYDVQLDTGQAQLLAGMGPSGHHEVTGGWDGGPVTIDVDVSAWSPAAL